MSLRYHEKFRLSFRILSVFTGVVFLFSAFAKLYPVEFFEVTLVETGFIDWHIVPYLARFIISIEAFIGLVLVSSIRIGKWFYYLIILTLSVFTAYLIYQFSVFGNTGNCGCFGNAFKMTPLEGILKNIFLLGIAVILLFYHKGFKIRLKSIILLFSLTISLVLPFVINPVSTDSPSYLMDEKVGYRLDLDMLYKDDKPEDLDVREGKNILAVLSLTCSHCKVAAYKLQAMKRQNPDLPIYLILNGDIDDLDEFFEETKADIFPYKMLKGSDIIKLSGPSLPAIFMIEDQVVYKKINYQHLNPEELDEWLSN